MKLRIRKSNIKRKRRHGFRAKPKSHRRRVGTKLKDLRRRRRKKKNWTIHRKNP